MFSRSVLISKQHVQYCKRRAQLIECTRSLETDSMQLHYHTKRLCTLISLLIHPEKFAHFRATNRTNTGSISTANRRLSNDRVRKTKRQIKRTSSANRKIVEKIPDEQDTI